MPSSSSAEEEEEEEEEAILSPSSSLTTTDTLNKNEKMRKRDDDGLGTRTIVSPTQLTMEKFSIPMRSSSSSSSSSSSGGTNSHHNVSSEKGSNSNGSRNEGSSGGIFGIGWGDAASRTEADSRRHSHSTRQGIVIEFEGSLSTTMSVLSSSSSDASVVIGLGEVSPLPGLHNETLEDAQCQLEIIQDALSSSSKSSKNIPTIPSFVAEDILSLDGSLETFVNALVEACNINVDTIHESVRSGIEMAILSLSSHAIQLPLLQALAINSKTKRRGGDAEGGEGGALMSISTDGQLPLNGIALRNSKSLHGDDDNCNNEEEEGRRKTCTKFSSMKIKIGQSTPKEDALRVLHILDDEYNNDDEQTANVRVDANRLWDNESSIYEFVNTLYDLGGSNLMDKLEYMEEPLKLRHLSVTKKYSTDEDGEEGVIVTASDMITHIQTLEEIYDTTGISYALDETISDLVCIHNRDIEKITKTLTAAFSLAPSDNIGCAAFILKPSLIGFDLSHQLARLAKTKFAISAVFTSCFDTGLGLSYGSFLAFISDSVGVDNDSASAVDEARTGANEDQSEESPVARIGGKMNHNNMASTKLYPHGFGTYDIFVNGVDIISPTFSTYVNVQNGILDALTLSSDLYGLNLNQMKENQQRKQQQQQQREEKSDDEEEENYLNTPKNNSVLPKSRSKMGYPTAFMRKSSSSFNSSGSESGGLPAPAAAGVAVSSTGGTTTTTTFTSSTEVKGRQIIIKASLLLPFSDLVACSRFTDLPQQPRWSPWLKSVQYISNTETEWILNILGNPFRWRAVSTLLNNPKGIAWESVSGLRNEGSVTFIPSSLSSSSSRGGGDELTSSSSSSSSCIMSVKVNFIAPRGINALFRAASSFSSSSSSSGGSTSILEEFLQKKLLKWSLEMFRDVVKADLALERGDLELGDALFGAVEGRATAIEATLTSFNQTINF